VSLLHFGGVVVVVIVVHHADVIVDYVAAVGGVGCNSS